MFSIDFVINLDTERGKTTKTSRNEKLATNIFEIFTKPEIKNIRQRNPYLK